jgi:hypothetical protein
MAANIHECLLIEHSIYREFLGEKGEGRKALNNLYPVDCFIRKRPIREHPRPFALHSRCVALAYAETVRVHFPIIQLYPYEQHFFVRGDTENIAFCIDLFLFENTVAIG